MPRIARHGAVCLISIIRQARIEKFEFDEGSQPYHPLGEHKSGRIKPGRIKRAALSLQNQKYYICCFLLGETSQHKATTGSPNFHGALGAHPNSEKERDEYTTGIYIHGLTGMGKSTEVQKTLKGKDVNLLRDSPPPTRATQRAGVFLFFVIFVSISFSELRQQPSFGSGSQRN